MAKDGEIEVRKTTTITLPVDIYELVKNDNLILSHFVENALRDHFELRTKESSEIMKIKQQLENELEILENNKENYIKEFESKKADINFKLSQLDDKKKEAIEIDLNNDKLDKLVSFLKLNKSSRRAEFIKDGKNFINENDVDITIEKLLHLKETLDPITPTTVQEYLDMK